MDKVHKPITTQNRSIFSEDSYSKHEDIFGISLLAENLSY
jgi:hypothetical protein